MFKGKTVSIACILQYLMPSLGVEAKDEIRLDLRDVVEVHEDGCQALEAVLLGRHQGEAVLVLHEELTLVVAGDLEGLEGQGLSHRPAPLQPREEERGSSP